MSLAGAYCQQLFGTPCTVNKWDKKKNERPYQKLTCREPRYRGQRLQEDAGGARRRWDQGRVGRTL